MSKWVKGAALAVLMATPAMAEELGLGRPATEAEIAAWNIDVRPDGQGLPEGQGSALDGEETYANQCAHCHGVFGEGEGRWPQLAGGIGSLSDETPIKTVGSYWPYASTLFDYVHRAMPFGEAQSLSDDDVYALTAYILYMNDIIDDDEFVLSKDSFAEVEMPNEGGFVPDDRIAEYPKGEPCMSDCTDGPVAVTMRARVLDVTPDEE